MSSGGPGSSISTRCGPARRARPDAAPSRASTRRRAWQPIRSPRRPRWSRGTRASYPPPTWAGRRGRPSPRWPSLRPPRWPPVPTIGASPPCSSEASSRQETETSRSSGRSRPDHHRRDPSLRPGQRSGPRRSADRVGAPATAGRAGTACDRGACGPKSRRRSPSPTRRWPPSPPARRSPRSPEPAGVAAWPALPPPTAPPSARTPTRRRASQKREPAVRGRPWLPWGLPPGRRDAVWRGVRRRPAPCRRVGWGLGSPRAGDRRRGGAEGRRGQRHRADGRRRARSGCGSEPGWPPPWWPFWPSRWELSPRWCSAWWW